MLARASRWQSLSQNLISSHSSMSKVALEHDLMSSWCPSKRPNPFKLPNQLRSQRPKLPPMSPFRYPTTITDLIRPPPKSSCRATKKPAWVPSDSSPLNQQTPRRSRKNRNRKLLNLTRRNLKVSWIRHLTLWQAAYSEVKLPSQKKRFRMCRVCKSLNLNQNQFKAARMISKHPLLSQRLNLRLNLR